MPEEYLRDRLAVILGGRTAEKALLGSVSSGADDDIRQATALARAMVSRWGMSEEIEHSAQHVDEAVKALLLEAEQRAEHILQEHRKQLEGLITLLEKQETLERPDIEQCLGPVPKKRELGVIGSP